MWELVDVENLEFEDLYALHEIKDLVLVNAVEGVIDDGVWAVWSMYKDILQVVENKLENRSYKK
jgi:hypothetical protein